MKARRVWILLAILVLFVSTILAQGDGDGNNGNANGNGNLQGNNGNGNGNGNSGGNNGNGNGNGNAGGNNGNGNGNGNAGGNNGNGNGNGNGDGDGDGQGSSGSGNGNGEGQSGSSGNGNGNGDGQGSSGGGDGEESNGQKRKRPAPPPPPAEEAAAGSYRVLPAEGNSGQERGYCLGAGGCQFKTLTCPADCPETKPKKNRRNKGCFLDCSSSCQATCKWRKPNCNEYGSICYDPRFVGGDGVMFYFHGSKGNNFAVVSDQTLHINAHFIGNRPQGRTRDFTWVQAISLMFDTNTLVLAANRVSQWNDKVDALIVKWNGDSISVPTDGESEWRITTGEKREVVIERTVDVNTVRATVSGLVEMDMRVTPIGEKENRVHHYQLPSDDAFAHLEVQFSFFNLSNGVEGVLGKTYRPGYVSPVKRGVPMPIMGGEDKYRTPSLYSPSCKLCIFQRPSAAIAVA